MHEFETLGGFLEHVALVMDADAGRRRRARVADDAARAPRVSSSTPCSCPAGRRGCFPTSARSTRAAARGSRRSAASPTSASRAPSASRKVSFAQNRRNRGLYQSAMPVALRRRAARGARRGAGGQEPVRRRLPELRRDPLRTQPLRRARAVPATYADAGLAAGYRRPAGSARRISGTGARPAPRGPMTIEGELVAASIGDAGVRGRATRVRHQKFGPGTVAESTATS